MQQNAQGQAMRARGEKTMATFLVTGATGLIGRQFTRLLLSRPDDDRVTLVVRASSKAKLATLVDQWPHSDRVKLVTGDLGEPLLGVSEADRDELRGTVDHVVHLAALYDLTAEDRKSTRLNSSHSQISYAVFCLKKKTCT